jgi:hypothetical protein
MLCRASIAVSLPGCAGGGGGACDPVPSGGGETFSRSARQSPGGVAGYGARYGEKWVQRG